MKFGKFKIDLLALIIVVGLMTTLGTLALENGVFSGGINYTEQEKTCLLLDEEAIYSHQLDMCLTPKGDGLWQEH